MLLASEPVVPGAGRVRTAALGWVRDGIEDRAAVEGEGRRRGLVEWVGVLAGGDGVGEGERAGPAAAGIAGRTAGVQGDLRSSSDDDRLAPGHGDGDRRADSIGARSVRRADGGHCGRRGVNDDRLVLAERARRAGGRQGEGRRIGVGADGIEDRAAVERQRRGGGLIERVGGLAGGDGVGEGECAGAAARAVAGRAAGVQRQFGRAGHHHRLAPGHSDGDRRAHPVTAVSRGRGDARHGRGRGVDGDRLVLAERAGGPGCR